MKQKKIYVIKCHRLETTRKISTMLTALDGGNVKMWNFFDTGSGVGKKP